MTETKEYYKQLLKVCKAVNAVSLYPKNLIDGEDGLNKTERNLLAVLCAADTEGERVISTQIADKLGVTRSAVSQMIDKLESMQYVRRVSSPTDRKIAYIELSAEMKRRYDAAVDRSCAVLDGVLSRMGERNVNKMLDLFDCFARTLKEAEKESAHKS